MLQVLKEYKPSTMTAQHLSVFETELGDLEQSTDQLRKVLHADVDALVKSYAEKHKQRAVNDGKHCRTVKRRSRHPCQAGLWTCLPPLLQQACGFYDQLHEREAFLHGALPVLSRICENVVMPMRDMDHQFAIQVYVTGESASGKGCAGHATALLDVICENRGRTAAH